VAARSLLQRVPQLSGPNEEIDLGDRRAILFIVVVTTAVDVILHLAHVFPPLNEPITRWYPVALVVLSIPQCWAGAKRYGEQVASRGTLAAGERLA
jgi:hypothetical protein